jgi:hypothetical protein
MQKEEERHHLSSLLLKVERLKWEILQKTSGNKSPKQLLLLNVLWDILFEITNEAKRVSYKVVKGTTIHHVLILMVYTLHLSAMTLQKMKKTAD